MTRLLFLIFLLLLEACSPPDYLTRQPEDQVLVLNIYSEPPTLDPGKAVDLSSVNTIGLLFEGLTRPSSLGKTALAVAERVETSTDGLTYTFHLRPSLWSNGDPISAKDFEYAWKRILSPSFPASFAYQLYVIKNARAAKEGNITVDEVGIEALDERILRVTLAQPTPYFLEMLSLPCFLPVHRSTVKNHEDWAYEAGPLFVSNGPFTLESWTHHNELRVKRNPKYWDAEKVRLKEVILLMVEDVNTELGLFEDGVIDWAGKPISMGLPTDAIPALLKRDQLELQPMAATYFYLLNVKEFPFNHVKMRRAFALAINRKAIVENILQGGEQPATGIIAPPLSLQQAPYFNDHDLPAARKLFQEALTELGVNKESLPKITLSYNTGESHHKVAQAVQQQWERAFGIRVGLENLEWKVYLDKIEHRHYSIARMSWVAAFNDPISFLDIFKEGDNVMNLTGWENEEYTGLLNASMTEKDSKRRLELLRKAETKLIEEMPVIPVYHLTNSFMKKKSLKNVVISPTGWIDFKEAYFETDSP